MPIPFFISKLHWKSFLLFAVVALYSFQGYGQITVKFKPDSLVGKDAFLEFSNGCVIGGRPAASELVNFGVHPELYYMQWTYSSSGCGQGTQRTLIKFNQLSSIPTTAVITNAELNLFGVNSSGSYGTSYYPGSPYTSTNEGWVERVTGSWNEFTVTWNTQPTTTTTNRVGIPFSTAHWNWNTSVDVTTLVNDIRASGTNEGFMLKLKNEAIYRCVLFASSDHPDTTRWPELVITYLDPCSGTMADFNYTNSSCYTFQFNDNSIAKDSGIVSWTWDFGDMTSSSIRNPTKTYADYGDYTVRLIVKDSGGCMDTITKLVSIKYNHFANAGRDTILCLDNNSATTFLRGNGGLNYSWSPSALLSHPESKNTYATISAATSFILSVVDLFGCKDKDTVEVKLHPKTIINNRPKDTTICKGNSIQLNASGAISYSWSPATSLNNSKINNPIAVNISSAKTYIVQGTDANGCQGLDTINIRLYPAAIIKATPNDYKGCKGDAITLNVSGGINYKWYPSEGLNNDSIANPSHIIGAPIKYFVKGQTIEGCYGEDSITIDVYPAPVVDAYSIAGQNIVRCKGVEINLNATGASRYTWSPAEYCSSPNNSTTVVFPSANTLFTVTGINDLGCAASDTISVIYEGVEKVMVPNTFSPNNDLLNDNIGVIDQCNIQFISIDIFNRWGQKVFSGYDIADKWDGNFNNKPCDIGTYYYLIKAHTLSGHAINFKGDITLIR
jgi:gliding motility-associated-like protein